VGIVDIGLPVLASDEMELEHRRAADQWHHPSPSRATTSNATLSGSVLRAVRNRRGSARLLDLP
jgi:hypothetical protein